MRKLCSLTSTHLEMLLTTKSVAPAACWCRLRPAGQKFDLRTGSVPGGGEGGAIRARPPRGSSIYDIWAEDFELESEGAKRR